jgi:ribosomal subunit interface protein
MQVPLDIQFRNMSTSDAVEAAVRRRVAKLEQLAGELISCKVTIEAPHRRHRQGNLFSVSVDLRQSGREMPANRTPQASREHEDVYVALRNAFDAARRQLIRHVRTRRGDVKHHGPLARRQAASAIADADADAEGSDAGRPMIAADGAYGGGSPADLAKAMSLGVSRGEIAGSGLDHSRR